MGRQAVAPDGHQYAQPDVGGSEEILIVEVASGAARRVKPSLARPADSTWVVMNFTANGIYLAIQENGPTVPGGLYLMDPATGRVRVVNERRAWQVVAEQAAWGLDDPLTGHGPGPGSRLVRLDLQSGTVESWFKSTSEEFLVVGVDGMGSPVLETSKPHPRRLLIVTGREMSTPIPAAPGVDLPVLSNFIHPVADRYGLWFGDVRGRVFLYPGGGDLRLVATVGSDDVAVAGVCRR